MKTAALSTAIIAVACAFGVGAQEAGMPALEALNSALRDEPSWQAEYTQEYVAAGMAAGDEVSGRGNAGPDHRKN